MLCPRSRLPNTFCAVQSLQPPLLTKSSFQVLNVGLLIGALFHILELGSLLVDGGIQVSGNTRMRNRLDKLRADRPRYAWRSVAAAAKRSVILGGVPTWCCPPPLPAVALAAALPVCPLAAGAHGICGGAQVRVAGWKNSPDCLQFGSARVSAEAQLLGFICKRVSPPADRLPLQIPLTQCHPARLCI